MIAPHCSPNKSAPTEGSLGLVRFPEAWVKASPDGRKVVLTQPQQLEVRSTPGDLLFAVRLPDGSYSDNYYAVSLDGKFQVRVVSKEEWGQANRIAQGDAVDREQHESIPGTNHFVRSGESRGNPPGRFSPDRAWLALFSYTSKEQPVKDASKDSNLFLGGGEPSNGRVFLDLYEVSSGELTLSGQAPYSGFGPSVLFSQTFWLGNNYLVMPLDISSQTCFLGILPRE